MSTGPNRILDELARLMTDAAGAAQGVRREVEGAFRSQAERILNTMEVVQREEFEAVRDMATKARSENQKLLQTGRSADRADRRVGGRRLETAGGRPAGRAGKRRRSALPEQIRRNNCGFFPQASGSQKPVPLNRLQVTLIPCRRSVSTCLAGFAEKEEKPSANSASIH